ncbi:DUF58 domain-containing protein [Flavobacteriaceae bacterium Ap0902]|nr:DUF58 domain-containing protein [Flavobacteriaceae bacterium Ap0902]
MRNFFRQLYLSNRFFYALGVVAVLYILSFFFDAIAFLPPIVLMLLLIILVIDIVLLFNTKKGIIAQRILPEKLSNGDENLTKIDIKNHYPFAIKVEVIDEAPFQFQLRDFRIHKKIKSNGNEFFQYSLEPKERGEYHFGELNIFATSPIGLIKRRTKFSSNAMVPSYPSFIHLPKYELMAMQNEFMLGGIKKIRKIGHTMEFEQIKDYVQGDDIRNINWKATAKRNQLMVNQYQEERAQRIYMLIDKGRTMKMPFDGLTLLDYSINASMALSHIVLKKKDNAGIMTFSKKIENVVPAESRSGQLKKIGEALYNVETNFYESDFSRLYVDLEVKVRRRSLILLFSNFETLDALNRQLRYLRGIAKNHLLVVVFFKNSAMDDLSKGKKLENIQNVYDQIIAEKFEYEKKLIRQELQKYGISSVYTAPENLSISVINKYLEVKARGIL